MKRIAILGIVVALLSALTAGTVVAAKPTTFTVSYNQAQFQWRAWDPMPSGTWTPLYLTYAASSGFRLTGNVLHTAWSYSPVVTDLEGESTVYVCDKANKVWIEKEGTVSYKYEPYYGDYPIANYFRGYLEFQGPPSQDSFVHGVAYQWAYLLAPHEVPPSLPYAEWDETMGAWLVGFSIYLWDPSTPSPPYDIEFPDPFLEPVPASDFNPLDL
jgi:hypothetical protein